MHPVITRDTIVDERYRIVKQLAAGAHAVVYLAEEFQLQRTVALKIIKLSGLEDQEAVSRFEREAQALSRLSHKNILQVLRLGRHSTHFLYLAMEYVPGENLRQRIDRRSMSLSEVLATAIEVAEALHQAEMLQITHRDVKPDNVLLTQSPATGRIEAKLADFGLCTLRENAAYAQGHVTRTGVTLGTPTYMSPEQCFGAKADARSDIYSFGCLLFEMLSGSPPFVAASPAELLSKHVSSPPPRLLEGARSSGLPPQLQEIYLRCLAKEPDQRFQSFAAVTSALKDIELPLTGTDRPTSDVCAPPARAHQSPLCKSNKALIGGFAICSAAVLMLTFATTGEQKGRVIGHAAAMVARDNQVPLLISGIQTVYVLNGPVQASAAADASIGPETFPDRDLNRSNDFNAAYLKFFRQKGALEHCVHFATTLIDHFLDRLNTKEGNPVSLSPAETSQLGEATNFLLAYPLKRDDWRQLNQNFDDWDRNRKHSPIAISGQTELQMRLEELEAKAVHASGAIVLERQYRRAAYHYLNAMICAWKLNQDWNFNSYKSKLLSLPGASTHPENEILARFLAAKWATRKNRPAEAEAELKILRGLKPSAQADVRGDTEEWANGWFSTHAATTGSATTNQP